jgi:roadblock/LC7 domain-containing protein
VIRPGDCVFFEADDDHWHGAAPNRFMTHLAMQEIDDQGSPVTWGEHVTDEEYSAVSPELAAGAAQFCGTVSLLFDTLSGAFSQMSGMNWTPQQGWAYSRGDWTVAVGAGGRKGVFIETAKADLNNLFRVLVSES